MAPLYASWETNGERILHWGKLISITGSKQILIQAIGLIVGIMTVRLLPIKEYAWFTIANTMLPALALLSDGGISSGVFSEGGKKWQSKEWLGSILLTALELRKKLALVNLAIFIPILSYLLGKNGANWGQILLIVLALIPAFYASLSDVLLEIPLKLHQDVIFLQKNEFYAAFIRLAFTVSSILIFPFTFIALLGNSISRIAANRKLKRRIQLFADTNLNYNPEAKQIIISIVKKTIPGIVFYVFSGQISIWLISVFGNTAAVAQLGALGRFTVIFSTFSIISNILVIPRFAKLKDEKNILNRRFLEFLTLSIIFSFFIFILSYIFSSEALLILGNSYKGLEQEFILNIIVSLLAFLSGLLFSLCSVRGWVINPIYTILINLIIIIVSIFIFDYSSISGILYMAILQNLIGFLMQAYFCYSRILSIR